MSYPLKLNKSYHKTASKRLVERHILKQHLIIPMSCGSKSIGQSGIRKRQPKRDRARQVEALLGPQFKG